MTMLSRVGFNHDLDQALVYMAHRCGTECGVGKIYFLVREEETWKVESTINVWYSWKAVRYFLKALTEYLKELYA